VSISRRHFVGLGVSAAAGLTLDRQAARAEVIERNIGSAGAFAGSPVVIASANGIRGVARAYDMITKHNADSLDAVMAGVNSGCHVAERQFVGLSGLPNERGRG